MAINKLPRQILPPNKGAQLGVALAVILYTATMLLLLGASSWTIAVTMLVFVIVRLWFIREARRRVRNRALSQAQQAMPFVKGGCKVPEALPYVKQWFQPDPITGKHNETIVEIQRHDRAKIIIEVLAIASGSVVLAMAIIAVAGMGDGERDASRTLGMIMLAWLCTGMFATDRIIDYNGYVWVLTDSHLAIVRFYAEWVFWRSDGITDMMLKDVSFKDPKRNLLARILGKKWGTLGQDTDSDDDKGLRRITWVSNVYEARGLINSQQTALFMK